MNGLTNRQQAFLMLLVFLLPSFGTWAALGYPTETASLGILGSATISGILAFVKELLGSPTPTI
jgi:hypothetical protein